MKGFDFSHRFIGSIEFAGTICAGKMTLLEALKTELKKSRSSIEIIAEDLTIQSKAVTTASHYERQILLVNLVAAGIIRSRSDRLLLVHRGLYDAIAFMTAYIKFGLAKEDIALPQINAWRVEANRLIDAVVYVKTPAEVAYKRAKKKFSMLFRMKADPIFDKNFFEVLERCYSSLEEEIPVQKLIVVDGKMPPKNNVEIILERLMGLFNGNDSNSENGKEAVDTSIAMRMMGYAD
jgi:hypothetical protein